jgi:UDP-N-acetylmuramate dehydrogenase
MQISYRQSLRSFNTFGVDVCARLLCKAGTYDDIKKILTFAKHRALKVLFLGGGSNILLARDFDGVVILLEGFIDVDMCSCGTHRLVRVGAGVNWDGFVQYCAEAQLQGIESLAGIPGTVGAAPIQNIGAYGAEVADCLIGVEVLDRLTHTRYWLPRNDLGLGYRDSVFKLRYAQRLVILSVLFQMRECGVWAQLDTKIREELGVQPQARTLTEITAAVRRVRNRRLPEPGQLGNAGSFFVNPVVSAECMARLVARYSQFPAFEQPGGRWKLSAGWLIQQCVAVGFRVNRVGIYTHNPLVVINHGGATGAEIVAFGELLRQLVFAKFHIELKREPVFIE